MSCVLEHAMFKRVVISSLMCSAHLSAVVLAGLAPKTGNWSMYYPKQVEKCRKGKNISSWVEAKKNIRMV